MFDINTLFAQALQQAVEQATAPLIARVTALETIKSEQADYMAGLCDRIAALELQQGPASNNSVFTAQALTGRIQRLEMQIEPFTDLASNAFIERLDQQEWFWEKVSRFVAKEGGTDLTEERVGAMIEDALDTHNSDYDHDSYDDAVSKVDEYDLDDFLTKDALNSELRDQINDTLNNASISISV